MTNGMKKLDEYNLMVLREQLSLPANKYCFDCHQRGPTYVNVTIGSFVCTSCSGLLRGLTPPHRVKSISMATFNTEEIDFIKSRGNENCQSVWLGMHGSKQPTKDEKQIKDFMVDKYEKKIYYFDSVSQKIDNGIQSKPVVTNVTSTHQKPSINTSPVINISTSSKFDFFKEESSPQNEPLNSSQSFANFDNNPAFSTPFDTSKNIGVAIDSPSTSWKSNGFQVPAEDRYAALKDLDCLMKSQVQQDPIPLPPSQLDNSNNSAWSSDASINDTWGNQVSENTTQNPFRSCTQDSWASSNHVINPFTNNKEDDWQNNIQWPNSLTSSQSMGFNDTKPWSADFSNPFKVGSASSLEKHSSNPFL